MKCPLAISHYLDIQETASGLTGQAAVFRLGGEEWEVIEADASSGLVKYPRLCEGDAEQEIALGELEEVTLDEACVHCVPMNRWKRLHWRWMRSYCKMMKQWQCGRV